MELPTIKNLISSYVIDYFSYKRILIAIRNEKISLSWAKSDLEMFKKKFSVKILNILVILALSLFCIDFIVFLNI